MFSARLGYITGIYLLVFVLKMGQQNARNVNRIKTITATGKTAFTTNNYIWNGAKFETNLIKVESFRFLNGERV